MLEELSVSFSEAEAEANLLREQGQTVMCVAINGLLAGFLGVMDPIKETTVAAIKALRDSSVNVIMITEDNERTAKAVAKKVGLDQFLS